MVLRHLYFMFKRKLVDSVLTILTPRKWRLPTKKSGPRLSEIYEMPTNSVAENWIANSGILHVSIGNESVQPISYTECGKSIGWLSCWLATIALESVGLESRELSGTRTPVFWLSVFSQQSVATLDCA